MAARRGRAPAGRRRHRRRLGSRRGARGVPRQAARARSGDRPGRVGAGRGVVILLIDNYASFSWTLAHLFGALGADVVVRRNDELDADEAERLAPSHLVVAPGPGRPAAAGATPALIERLLPTTPTLGVCLGHQALVEACGGEVGYARELVHGKASPVRHDGSGLFTGLPDPFEAGGHHPPAATPPPRGLGPTAVAGGGGGVGVRGPARPRGRGP